MDALKVGFLDHDSVANVQGLGSLPRVRLERRLGKLQDEVMAQIIGIAVSRMVGFCSPRIEMTRTRTHFMRQSRIHGRWATFLS